MPIQFSLDHQLFTFDEPAISIGRARDNLLALPQDIRLEEHHVILRCVQNRWIIEAVDVADVKIAGGRPGRVGWLSPGDSVLLTESGPELQFEPVAAKNRAAVGPKKTEPKVAVPAAFVPLDVLPTTPPPAPSLIEPLSNQASRKTSARSETRLSHRTLVSIASVLVLLPLAYASGMYLARGTSTPIVDIPPVVTPLEESRLVAATPSPESTAIPTFPSATSASTAELPPAKLQPALDPNDLLVLVGVGDLLHEARPHILGMGWLWDSQTVVVSRDLGLALDGLIQMAKEEGHSLQVCVIQGIPIQLSSIEHPAQTPQISRLRLQEPAELTVTGKDCWKSVTAVDVERMRGKGKKFSYVSYRALPRHESAKGSHGLSLVAYDPELIQITSIPASFLYEQRRHAFKPLQEETLLERGGILVDEDQNLVGMVLRDASVIWGDQLNPSNH
jgi:hypothetical protein